MLVLVLVQQGSYRLIRRQRIMKPKSTECYLGVGDENQGVAAKAVCSVALLLIKFGLQPEGVETETAVELIGRLGVSTTRGFAGKSGWMDVDGSLT